MGKYTGDTCLICQEPFHDDDDIVVCPDCGTPYHRACYLSQGHCINQNLHAVGGSYESARQDKNRHLGGTVCPKCRYVNAPGAKYCSECGTTLTSEEGTPIPGSAGTYFDATDPCCGLSPDEPVENETLGDVAGFVRTNTLYYIPLFRRFRDTGKKLSLNFSCMLFPDFYFAFRKMWGMAILCCLLDLICWLPYMLLGLISTLSDPDMMQQLVQLYGTGMQDTLQALLTFLQPKEAFLNDLSVPLYLACIAMRSVLCLFGNYLYYRHVLKKVGHIRQHAATPQLRQVLLHVEGGTSFWNVAGCILLYYALEVLILGILMTTFV